MVSVLGDLLSSIIGSTNPLLRLALNNLILMPKKKKKFVIKLAIFILCFWKIRGWCCKYFFSVGESNQKKILFIQRPLNPKVSFYFTTIFFLFLFLLYIYMKFKSKYKTGRLTDLRALNTWVEYYKNSLSWHASHR